MSLVLGAFVDDLVRERRTVARVHIDKPCGQAGEALFQFDRMIAAIIETQRVQRLFDYYDGQSADGVTDVQIRDRSPDAFKHFLYLAIDHVVLRDWSVDLPDAELSPAVVQPIQGRLDRLLAGRERLVADDLDRVVEDHGQPPVAWRELKDLELHGLGDEPIATAGTLLCETFAKANS